MQNKVHKDLHHTDNKQFIRYCHPTIDTEKAVDTIGKHDDNQTLKQKTLRQV